MDVDSQRFYGRVLVVLWFFVLPDCMYGLGKQEYAWVETYQGLSQRWIPDTGTLYRLIGNSSPLYSKVTITAIESIYPQHQFEDEFENRYRSGTVNSNTVNSKFHLIGSFFEILARILSFHV